MGKTGMSIACPLSIFQGDQVIRCVFPSGRVIDDVRWVNGKRTRVPEETFARLAQEFPSINYFFSEGDA